MKTKKKDQTDDIREINIDELLGQLNRSELNGPPSPRITKEKPERPTKTRPDMTDLSSSSAPPVAHQPTEINDASISESSPILGLQRSPDGGDKVSRAKKQRLRLLRKLQQKDQMPNPLQLQTEGSESDAALSVDDRSGTQPSPTDKSARTRSRRNYVERNSSIIPPNPTGSCGWKDVVCILFVLLLVTVAGILKFQEEVFSSTSHLRTESDSDADFYEILGIPHSATTKDIKRAYRTKVLEVHPDRHPACADCGQVFMATTKAYEVLIDDEKRRIYDHTRGSYEPILSDFSVSLTSFNFDKLVTSSASVWIIQVYDDLEPLCKSFASQWDAVAGSHPHSDLMKFGRVNARRDQAVLSLLPIKPRTFPTVVMYSRDTMPSIFSLADTSSRALERWINKEAPSHVNESPRSNNEYALTMSGRSADPSLAIRVSSVEFVRIFDVSYVQNKTSGSKAYISIAVIDKRTKTNILEVKASDDSPQLLQTISDIKERLSIPLNRDNIFDVCGNTRREISILCMSQAEDIGTGIIQPKATVVADSVVQRVRWQQGSMPIVLFDVVASRMARLQSGSELDDIEDISFDDVDMSKFINEHFPLSGFDYVKLHSTSIIVTLLLVAGIAPVTRVGAATLMLVIAALSILVGVLSSPLADLVKGKLR